MLSREGWAGRDSSEKWGDRKLFTCREGGEAIFKCLKLLICRAAKPLYMVANVKLVLGTSRSPWPIAWLCLECKCGWRQAGKKNTLRTLVHKSVKRQQSKCIQTEHTQKTHVCLWPLELRRLKTEFINNLLIINRVFHSKCQRKRWVNAFSTHNYLCWHFHWEKVMSKK